MAFGAPNKQHENAPRVISIKLGANFNEEFQRQIEDAVASMTPEQKLASLILLGLSLLVQFQDETVLDEQQDESAFAWSYLSRLQKELPEGGSLSDLLREANIKLLVNDQPVDLNRLSKSAEDLTIPSKTSSAAGMMQ